MTVLSKVKWCELLSVVGHRSCRNNDCTCQCHVNMSPKNYTIKGNRAKVRRVG